jgi:hypothetical protein
MSNEEATAAPAPDGSPGVPGEPVLASKPPAPRPGRRRPVLEWFWRGQALKNAQREIEAERNTYGVFEQRAREAAEFARRAIDPGSARSSGRADAIACELYLQSAYWALLALANTDASTSPSKLPFDLRAAMALVDRPLLLHAAGGALGLEEVEMAATLGDYFDAPGAEQTRVASILRGFAESLLALLSRKEQRVWLLHAQRLTRLGIILVALAAIAGTGVLGADWLEQRKDLARDKAWHASSTGASACNSPAQFCDESPGFFFHTALEKNPWIEIDLGAPVSFSAVRIINRRDCCRERASPLIIESSDDQKNWKQLARHEGTFSSFKARFPTVRARYLRVRIPPPAVTNLHLAAIRVLP